MYIQHSIFHIWLCHWQLIYHESVTKAQVSITKNQASDGVPEVILPLLSTIDTRISGSPCSPWSPKKQTFGLVLISHIHASSTWGLLIVYQHTVGSLLGATVSQLDSSRTHSYAYIDSRCFWQLSGGCWAPSGYVYHPGGGSTSHWCRWHSHSWASEYFKSFQRIPQLTEHSEQSMLCLQLAPVALHKSQRQEDWHPLFVVCLLHDKEDQMFPGEYGIPTKACLRQVYHLPDEVMDSLHSSL